MGFGVRRREVNVGERLKIRGRGLRGIVEERINLFSV